MKRTIEMLNQIITTAQIEGKRGRNAMAADRILQAASESTLLKAVSRFADLMQSDMQYIRHDVYAEFMAASQEPTAAGVLRLLREEPKFVALAATMKTPEERAEVAACLPVPSEDGKVSGVIGRPSYDIGLTVTLLSPLAHGADTKAGNATLFRRQALVVDGGLIQVPYYAGNALRGILRDLLADDFIQRLGLTPRRDRPPMALWFFHALYSGGALEEGGKALAAISKRLGNNGAINSSGIHEFRNMLPSLSILGCAIGSRILPGRIRVGDLRPRCQELGTGDKPVAELMGWEYLTRREKYENHEDGDNRSMIATTEIMRLGSVLEGGLDIDSHATDIELEAAHHACILLRDSGYLGAESRRGFGKIQLETKTELNDAPYVNYIESHRADIVGYLAEMGGLTPDEPKAASQRKTETIQQELF